MAVPVALPIFEDLEFRFARILPGNGADDGLLVVRVDVLEPFVEIRIDRFLGRNAAHGLPDIRIVIGAGLEIVVPDAEVGADKGVVPAAFPFDEVIENRAGGTGGNELDLDAFSWHTFRTTKDDKHPVMDLGCAKANLGVEGDVGLARAFCNHAQQYGLVVMMHQLGQQPATNGVPLEGKRPVFAANR